MSANLTPDDSEQVATISRCSYHGHDMAGTKTTPGCSFPQLALVVLLTLTALPDLAAAQQQVETDNELLRQGLELYEELEYERAVEVLSAALLEPGNSEQELLTIYQTLGTLYVFLGRQQEAALALERLLCVDNEFSFGEYASPRIREVFDQVRADWDEDQCEERRGGSTAATVTMDHESPNAADPGDQLDIQVVIEDPDGLVDAVVLHYRAAGEEGFNERPAAMTSPGTFDATIPSDAVAAPAAEYYVQAVNAEGEPLTALGTARAPLRVPVSGPGEGGSVARQWWFWTIIGVVVVGAGLGLGLGLGLDQDQPTDPSEATLTIFVCDGENSEVCFSR